MFLVFLLLSSCGVVQKKDGLTKLSFKESLRRNLQSIPPSANVIFVSTNWDTLTYEQVDSIFSGQDHTLDEYVNEEGVVEVFVMRKSTRRDKRRTKKLMRELDKQTASVFSETPIAALWRRPKRAGIFVLLETGKITLVAIT